MGGASSFHMHGRNGHGDERIDTLRTPFVVVASIQERGHVYKPDILRHRTAIKRYDLSKHVKLLLERGLFRKNETFFDYRCGRGMDVEITPIKTDVAVLYYAMMLSLRPVILSGF